MIKSRRMKAAGSVARIGRREIQSGFWWGNLKERCPFERQMGHNI